ncbi:NAD(P)-dependent alcohol dehydrogenase [Staphylococcus equorum]|uniref:NAD(P)-dependent alcohol dehydrogenase n=1 Tax=Staphylococcus TaxID=1279 RepID=UPI00085345E4|nr:NAD(P)-dependent alcohol dehydrogenase [Staphylococcus equorum]OEL06365.1 aryl-alcohol dehydrogenase [Staphylococcus equorum]
MQTKAIVSTKENDFDTQDITIDNIRDNEVLVKIVASGICPADDLALDGTMPTPKPAVLGHEGSGIVEKVGRNITSVIPGDHVVLGFSYCGHCKNCLSGNAGACEKLIPLNFMGENINGNSPLHDHDNNDLSLFFGQSSFAYHSVVDEKNVVKVPKNADLRLLGPLGCGIMTGSGSVLNSLSPEPGSSLVIFGTGAVGLSGLMAAKIAGCTTIIAVDIHKSRLELAKELGATHTINSLEEDPVEKIREITGDGANYSFETAGVDTVILQSIQCLKVKGVMATVSVGKKDLTLNVGNEIVLKGITVKGVIEGDAIPQLFVPKLVEFYQEGLFPFDKLVKFYSFNNIAQAFEDSKNGSTIKPIIVMD